MKAVLGIFLFITSAIALIFLVYFDINFFWYFLLVVTGSAGIFLVIGSGKKRIAAIERQIDQRIERLKANGEQIKLDFDSCEFTDSSYFHDAVDQSYSHYGVSDEITRTESVGQCILRYHHSIRDQVEKFTQVFPVGGDALKFYVLNGNITLYVDPFDRSNYFFDLKT